MVAAPGIIKHTSIPRTSERRMEKGLTNTFQNASSFRSASIQSPDSNSQWVIGRRAYAPGGTSAANWSRTRVASPRMSPEIRPTVRALRIMLAAYMPVFPECQIFVRCAFTARVTSPYRRRLERMVGVEPTQPAWKTGVLPLNYIRMGNYIFTIP